MKHPFNHPTAGAPRKHLPFACRDNATGGLKPVSTSGSRQLYCRRCPALKRFHRCLFGDTTAHAKLIAFRVLKKKDAARVTGFCARCHKSPAVEDYAYCKACRASVKQWQSNYSAARQRWKDEKFGVTTCAFPGGCTNPVRVVGNKTGMCKEHAPQFRANAAERRINRSFTTGATV